MNKKLKAVLVVLGLLASIFVVSNVITYALADKNVIEYFTSEDEEGLSGIWDELKRDGRQSVTIDDYTITLEAYLFEDKTNDGYACFSVEREGYDMREEIAGEVMIVGLDSIFGENNRFMIDVIGSRSCDVIYVKERDTMYVYYYFNVTDCYDFNNEILLYDNETYGEDWRDIDNAMCIYKLENNIDNLTELESKYE